MHRLIRSVLLPFICCSLAEEGDEYDRTLAIHNFLFGYEFATAIAFCRDPDTVVIITSAKKCKILEAIGKDDKPVPIKLQLHASNKGDKNAANIVTFINKLKASKSGVSRHTPQLDDA
jgi:nucleosome binding factor SPN SPT16 subunit